MEKEKTNNAGFPIEKIINEILKRSGAVTKEETDTVSRLLSDEIRKKPFKVAVIGQGGVGKTSTIQCVFGVQPSGNNIRTVAEGTTDVVEEKYEIADGFNLTIADLPGLKNDYVKDRDKYIPLYKKILPTSDLIIYIIDAHAKDHGIDIQILKEVVIPVCLEAGNTKNIIIALNKIDTIGQNFPEYLTDKEYHWDKVENKPTPTLAKLIEERLMDIYRKLVKANIFEHIEVKQSPAYSAVYAYNMQGFLEAILKSERGWIFAGTVAEKVMDKWSEHKQIK